MRLIFAFIFLFSLSTAATKTDLENEYYHRLMSPVPENTKVAVTHFTKSYGGVFKGYAEDFDGEGDFYFRAEHLAEALEKNTRDVLKGASKITGSTVTLKKAMKTVVPPPEEHNFTVTLPDK